jgi:hypothetical protein
MLPHSGAAAQKVGRGSPMRTPRARLRVTRMSTSSPQPAADRRAPVHPERARRVTVAFATLALVCVAPRRIPPAFPSSMR